MFKYLKNIISIIGLTVIASCSPIPHIRPQASLPVNEENCKIPEYDDKTKVASFMTLISLNEADYRNGTFRLGQIERNLKTLERKITIPFSEKLPEKYITMTTDLYDRNGDGFPDLIIEKGKPFGANIMSVDIDSDFDKIFERAVWKDMLNGRCLDVVEKNYRAERY